MKRQVHDAVVELYLDGKLRLLRQGAVSLEQSFLPKNWKPTQSWKMIASLLGTEAESESRSVSVKNFQKLLAQASLRAELLFRLQRAAARPEIASRESYNDPGFKRYMLLISWYSQSLRQTLSKKGEDVNEKDLFARAMSTGLLIDAVNKDLNLIRQNYPMLFNVDSLSPKPSTVHMSFVSGIKEELSALEKNIFQSPEQYETYFKLNFENLYTKANTIGYRNALSLWHNEAIDSLDRLIQDSFEGNIDEYFADPHVALQLASQSDDPEFIWNSHFNHKVEFERSKRIKNYVFMGAAGAAIICTAGAAIAFELSATATGIIFASTGLAILGSDVYHLSQAYSQYRKTRTEVIVGLKNYPELFEKKDELFVQAVFTAFDAALAPIDAAIIFRSLKYELSAIKAVTRTSNSSNSVFSKGSLFKNQPVHVATNIDSLVMKIEDIAVDSKNTVNKVWLSDGSAWALKKWPPAQKAKWDELGIDPITNELTAYTVSQEMGFFRVPETRRVVHNGEQAMLQRWVDFGSMKDNIGHLKVPKQVQANLADVSAFDHAIQNFDRHIDNLHVDPKTGLMACIDNEALGVSPYYGKFGQGHSGAIPMVINKGWLERLKSFNSDRLLNSLLAVGLPESRAQSIIENFKLQLQGVEQGTIQLANAL